jgi:fucose permease
MSAHPDRRARAAVVGAFALHAAVSGSLGPRLPAIKARSHVSDPGLGIALVGFAAGLFAGTRLAAWPVRRFGSRAALRIGVPIFAASLIGPAIARDLATLTIALMVMGLASGLLDVAMNANAVAVERNVGRPIMSGIHGVWSAGLLAASGAAVMAAALDTSPLAHFGVVAAVIAAASVPALGSLLGPAAERAAGDATSDGGRDSIDWRAVLPLGVIGFCSFLGEGAMHDWSAVYLRETLGATSAVAALGFTGFALGMTCSRLVADGLIVRFGPRRVVRTGGLVAGFGLVAALAVRAPAAGIGGFTVLGAALAPVVPTVFSAAGNLRAGPAALGWVVTISYVGGILGPALIGFTARATGLGVALGIPAALAIAIAGLASRVAAAPQGARAPGTQGPPAEGPW